MNRLLTLAAGILLFPTIVTAQQKAMIYPTLADYTQAKAITADVIIEKRSGGSIAMVGGCDYKIYSETDEALSKELKTNYIAVQRNDSLFINCDDILRSKWYGLAFYTSGDFIFFTASASSHKKHRRDMEYNMGGAIGGIEGAKLRYNYVIDLATGEVSVVNKASFEKIFKNHPLILEELKAKDYPPDTKTVLHYLDKAFGKE